MNIIESLKNAICSVLANKLRAILTMLGIVIGVGAIITTTSIGEGAKADITQQIQALGANVLVVRPGQQQFRGRSFGEAKTLEYKDAQILEEKGQFITAVAPEVSQRTQAQYKSKNTNTTIVGTTPEYQCTANAQLEQGAFFTDKDVLYRQRVCVLGKTVANDLFDEHQEPVGQTIKIRGLNFRVLGVLEEKGVRGPSNPDDRIFIPVTTAMKRVFGTEHLSSISVEIADERLLEAGQAEIEALLRQQHEIPMTKQLDFNVRSQTEYLETLEQSGQTFTYMILGIAVVSLVVGGIGIMNIMLVSVTERTREIGLRKAVGARRTDVLVQFLIESITLSLIGGIIGVGVGVVGSDMVPSVFGWRTIISPMYTMLAFLVAAWVGMFFGAYPAWRAAKLHPIEALRYQ